MHRMHNNVTIVNAIEVQECIVVIHGKIRNKRRNMEENPFSALINMQRNDVNQRQRSVFQTFRISTLLNHSPFTVKLLLLLVSFLL